MSEFSPLKMLSDSIKLDARNKSRSLQKEIGVSSIGGCRKQVYLEIINAPAVNETEVLPSWIGTELHKGFERVILPNDPFGYNFLIEQRLELVTPDYTLKGTVDLYIKDQKMVVDWKSGKKDNLKYFPSEQYIFQINLYAYILKMTTEYVPEWVAIVIVTKDGRLDQCVEYVAPYDEGKALEGIQWLKDMYQMAADKKVPEPEVYRAVCEKYCKFYSEAGLIGCPSKSPPKK